MSGRQVADMSQKWLRSYYRTSGLCTGESRPIRLMKILRVVRSSH